MKRYYCDRILPVILAVFLVLIACPPVRACSVCFTESGYLARYAYYATTVALILIPAGMVSGFVYWIRSSGSTNNEPVVDESKSVS